MIRHIVMFKMKEPVERTVTELKMKLDRLPAMIPQIREFETGLNHALSPAAYDLVLVSSFENEVDLDAYRLHPAHQEVLEYLNIYKENIVVVDYEKISEYEQPVSDQVQAGNQR